MIRPFQKRIKSSFSDRIGGLRRWLDTDSGRLLVDYEKSLLERELGTIFGFHAGQYSASWHKDLMFSSPVRRQFILGSSHLADCPRPQVMADPHYWPVLPGSLDLVLLQHTLEIVDSPHRLLSEAANTIIPDGKLIIIGFNPYSMTNIARWCVPGQRLLRDAHFISPSRLKDWLALLNFNVERIVYGGYVQPLKRFFTGLRGDLIEQRLEQLQLPVGGFYMMIATRETPGLTPVRKVWSDVRRRFVGQPLTRPSAGRTSSVKVNKDWSSFESDS
ncbi:methyltransferase domain-containing protein [Endozoicomonas acroporae]|uniref:methyltransferase domain-containing protein n=1 Tax=Endozoicomonas acroporae TaxID=1701104 RepID=UPI000C78768F|nr:methyltransferase domain-containing protein [Endozoicomonas acroporae]